MEQIWCFWKKLPGTFVSLYLAVQENTLTLRQPPPLSLSVQGAIIHGICSLLATNVLGC